MALCLAEYRRPLRKHLGEIKQVLAATAGVEATGIQDKVSFPLRHEVHQGVMIWQGQERRDLETSSL